jgi:hypothetical protein
VIKVLNYLQAKALLEHDYVVVIGNPLFDMPVYACYLDADIIICVEYISPHAGIMRYGDWDAFEELYAIAKESDTLMLAAMRYW